MATTTSTNRVSAQTLSIAGRLLEFLKDHLTNTDADAVMRDTLNDTEYTQAQTNLVKALTARGADVPLGAYAGGTSNLKNAVLADDVSGEQAQEAIGVLKASHRLIQCGRGRGKCLILIDATPLDEAEDVERSAPAPRAAKRATRARASTQAQATPARPSNGAGSTAPELETTVRAFAEALQASIAAIDARLRTLEGRFPELETTMSDVRRGVEDALEGMRNALDRGRMTW